MNTVILVFFAPMLAAGVVTLPAIYMDTLGGLQGIVVGYAASWLSAVLLSILAYAKYAQEIIGGSMPIRTKKTPGKSQGSFSLLSYLVQSHRTELVPKLVSGNSDT